MATSIIISPLLRTDIPEILEIEKESQPEPWSEKSFLEEIERLHSYLLAARIEDSGTGGEPPSRRIAGYICFWLVADEIQILNIVVRKDFRRRGIARRLLGMAIGAGREKKARCVNLEVRKSNAAAISLYRSLDFKIVGERPDYYGEQQEPAILMELELD